MIGLYADAESGPEPHSSFIEVFSGPTLRAMPKRHLPPLPPPPPSLYKIFVLSEDGDTFVIQAGSQYKLRRNSLNEMSLASPAVAGDSVFIRTATKLYKITRTVE